MLWKFSVIYIVSFDLGKVKYYYDYFIISGGILIWQ